MKVRKVSNAVIRRLPRYYRRLSLLKHRNIERISSSDLAKQLGLNPSQVRQDLNCFGGFGQQGYGYQVSSLHKEIASILGLTRTYSVIIAGAGNIGQALCKYEGFTEFGFETLALFDIDASLVGKIVCDRPVLHTDDMAEFIRSNNVDIGIIAARIHAAQPIADIMVNSGIRAIWNFVPVDINVPVPLENVHLSDSLLVLSYQLNSINEE